MGDLCCPVLHYFRYKMINMVVFGLPTYFVEVNFGIISMATVDQSKYFKVQELLFSWNILTSKAADDIPFVLLGQSSNDHCDKGKCEFTGVAFLLIMKKKIFEMVVMKSQLTVLQFTWSRSRSRFIFEGSEPEPPEIERLRNSGKKRDICMLYFSFQCYIFRFS